MKSENNRGFIKIIILILVVLVVLSYLGFDVKKIVYSPTVTKIASLVWSLLVLLWNLFVSIIGASWGTIVSGLESLIRLVQNIKTT